MCEGVGLVIGFEYTVETGQGTKLGRGESQASRHTSRGLSSASLVVKLNVKHPAHQTLFRPVWWFCSFSVMGASSRTFTAKE